MQSKDNIIQKIQQATFIAGSYPICGHFDGDPPSIKGFIRFVIHHLCMSRT